MQTDDNEYDGLLPLPVRTPVKQSLLVQRRFSLFCHFTNNPLKSSAFFLNQLGPHCSARPPPRCCPTSPPPTVLPPPPSNFAPPPFSYYRFRPSPHYRGPATCSFPRAPPSQMLFSGSCQPSASIPRSKASQNRKGLGVGHSFVYENDNALLPILIEVLFRKLPMKRWLCRCFSGPLQLLLLFCSQMAALSSDGSSDLQVQFRSLMHSGDHLGAIQVAQQLTRLSPTDGNSWYAARA